MTYEYIAIVDSSKTKFESIKIFTDSDNKNYVNMNTNSTDTFTNGFSHFIETIDAFIILIFRH